jgi:phosphatidylglycerophosphate synthase
VPPAITLAGAAWLGYDASVALAVIAIYAVAALLILRGAPGHLPGAGLGPANRVTLVRLALALPVGGFAMVPHLPDPATRWWLVALATGALALDGVDGWVARRSGTETAFGARFDMETDAALLMALSVVAWRAGPAGIWILGIGLLRYAFLAAGAVEPRLRGDLPEDQVRRKTVCVIQGIALPVAVAPLGLPRLQVGIAAAALGLLAWSFAVDSLWLLRNGARTD